ncbi:MAG: glutamyl-tRNA amidotransferase [Candidatus Nealsonbacteria bacterium CG01_land_8_20_14_3_00_12]|uniref:Glutamyl-tRNA amidotransferase n=3 Tax=Candidatus Nealsoniibacteriota TaxID=1817911 RepID=A0A2M7EC08_9BACT|nr:MAG: glutamyl-tRNA amidotransferase [Candidatus Nealsonbacteria bacterium CG01_land_8_20_14_3_00_12]PJA83355.1 MAG: glutamyl-tRNA amidotransferase [Candidatus Nealsonbacteria bacterium CG_4_9_14_3_um_filter_37_29]
MNLKGKIQNELQEAVKNREELKSSVLRLLLSAIFNKEKEKRYKLSKQKPEFKEKDLEKESQLVNEEVIEVISSEIKKRKESIELFEKGEREDLVEKETKEKEILEKYLPEQLSEEEIKKLAKETIEKIGAKEIKDMGKVMAELMPKVKGRADGGLVSKIAKELLAQ